MRFKKIRLRTYRDFVEAYWIVILAIVTALVFTLWVISTANALSIVFPIGMISRPWYIGNKRKWRSIKHSPAFHHNFIRRILSVMMFEFIFNKNKIVPITLLEENGITSGQVAYTTAVLAKRGIVKNYNARNLELVSFRKAEELAKSEVFKGGIAWT